jgi:LmbE family N-acetylglucosaminyl deacetylase
MIAPQRVLVMSPHTDDAELGCGGTIARWIDEGAELFTAAFSTAELSLPPGSKAYRLKDECHKALDELGVPPDNRFVYDFPVRELGYHRQEVLEERNRAVGRRWAAKQQQPQQEAFDDAA